MHDDLVSQARQAMWVMDEIERHAFKADMDQPNRAKARAVCVAPRRDAIPRRGTPPQKILPVCVELNIRRYFDAEY